MNINSIFCTVYASDEATVLGTLRNIVAGSMQRTEIHTGIGTLQFQVPNASTPSNLAQGCVLWFPELQWKYYVDEILWTSEEMVTLKCVDEMVKLTWATISFGAKYKMDVLTLISYLVEAGIAKATPNATLSADIKECYAAPWWWIKELSSVQQETTVAFEGETFLSAIIAVAKFYGAYFVLQKHSAPGLGAPNIFGVVKFGYYNDTPTPVTLYNTGTYLDYYINNYSIGAHPNFSIDVVANKLTLRPDSYKNRWSVSMPSFVSATLVLTGGADPYGYGLTIVGNKDFISPIQAVNEGMMQIDKITQTSSGTQLVNRLYMLGGGMFPYKDALGALVRDANGDVIEAPLNLSRAKNRQDIYPITYSPENKNWYMQANDSTLFPQVRERVVRYNEIVPLSASEADMNFAANSLYDIGKYLLNKYKNPAETYTIDLYGTVPQLKVSSVMRVDYTGSISTANGTVVIKQIQKLFYITKLQTTIDASGLERQSVSISVNGTEEMEFVDVVTDAFQEIKKINMRITPSISNISFPSPTQIITPTTPVRHQFFIDGSTYSINQLIADVYVQRLRILNWTADPSGGVTEDDKAISLATLKTAKAVFPIDWKWPHEHRIIVQNYAGDQAATHISVNNSTLKDWVDWNAAYAYILGVQYLPDGVAPNGNPYTDQSKLTSFRRNNLSPFVPPFSIKTEPNIQYGTFYDNVGNKTVLGAPDIPLDIEFKAQTLTLEPHETKLNSQVLDDVDANKVTGLTMRLGNLAVPLVLDTNASNNLIDVYRPNMTELINGADFKNKWHIIELTCTGGRANVFLNVRGRVTLLPISA